MSQLVVAVDVRMITEGLVVNVVMSQEQSCLSGGLGRPQPTLRYCSQ